MESLVEKVANCKVCNVLEEKINKYKEINAVLFEFRQGNLTPHQKEIAIEYIIKSIYTE